MATYTRWCERKGQTQDCLKILEHEGSYVRIGEYGRRTLAMHFAVDMIGEEAAAALKGMADPAAIHATLVTSMAVFLTLLVLPEPTSKAIAAHLATALITYLGLETFSSIVSGWMDLREVVRGTYSFDQIREAGQRFGSVLGRSAARVFVMLTTAAIGSTLGLAGKLPSLPGANQAAVFAANNGFQLSAVGQVSSVTVAASGTVSIVLPAASIAMSAPASGGGTTRAMGTLWRYPEIIDPRTGRAIPFPDGALTRVPQSQRVRWGLEEREAFIKEWYQRGYATPRGGWEHYDIHHIRPREFGGSNDFWNLVPVERGTHQELFNVFWREYLP
ncbi:MAG TPA: HNH endonuclease signature motif containing protein [Myxococcaceae bacterium]|nr:HNH endonuclease signature motif containing protein [Myxococcaceae bacterium]